MIFLTVIAVAVAAAVIVFAVEMSENRREFRQWKQMQEKNQSDNIQQTQNAQSDTSGQDDVSQTSSDAEDIGMKKAQEIAFSDAGVSDSDVINQSVKEENENGIKIYDVEFATSDWKYSYEIKASDGQIRQADRKRPDVNSSKASSGNSQISIDEAKKIAEKHAGVSGSVHYTKTKLEREDGRNVYEIEFYQNGTEYEFEILASDGSILDYSTERED